MNVSRFSQFPDALKWDGQNLNYLSAGDAPRPGMILIGFSQIGAVG